MKKTEFDQYSKSYRDIHTQNIGKVSGVDSDYFSEYKIRELFDRGIIKQERMYRWLDLGCGDGNTYQFVKKYFPNIQYSGIDISADSIEVAREKYITNAKANLPDFLTYDGVQIPFADATFDVVYLACVLHHVPVDMRADLISECKRVLKKTGNLIIFEHNPYNPVTLKMVNTCPFDADAVLLKEKELNRLCSNNRMHGKIRYTIFVPRKGIFQKMVKLEKYLSWLPLGGRYYGVYEKMER